MNIICIGRRACRRRHHGLIRFPSDWRFLVDIFRTENPIQNHTAAVIQGSTLRRDQGISPYDNDPVVVV
jgi:hypothetical protein